MTYSKLQVAPKGLFLAHACHSAGSDWREKRASQRGGAVDDKIWVRDVATHMNIYTFGQAGSAGAANIPTVKAMLDYVFTGKSKDYPFRAYAPAGVRLTSASAWPKLDSV